MMTLQILLKLADRFLKLRNIREEVRSRYAVVLVIFSRWYVETDCPLNALQNYDENLKNTRTNIRFRVESRIIVNEFLQWIETGRFQTQR